MSKLPVVKPREALKAVKKCGFVVDHTTGSHYTLYNADKSRRVSIAYHNKPLKRKTLTSIIKQAGLSVEEFKELL